MYKQASLRSLACALLSLPLLFASCSGDSPRPRQAEDETQHKGHEDPAGAEVVLRAGLLKEGRTFSESTTYEDVDFTPQAIQRATFESKAGGNKDLDFQVESTGKTPRRVYAIEISYRNAAGQPMNDQLISPDQLDRHQHFFRQVKDRTTSGYSYVERSETSRLFYKYAYCDVFDGVRNPVGFRGLIFFDRPTDATSQTAEVHIVLNHFYNTKYQGTDRSAVLPYYSSRAQQSTPDLTVPVTFHINPTTNP